MIVGIDCRLVHYQQGGISQYTKELVAALARLDVADQFLLLESRKATSALVSAANFCSRTIVTPPHHRWEQWLLPLELLPLTVDVLHSPDFIPPFLRRVRSVVTVHDLGFLHFPEALTADSRRYYSGQIARAVSSADHVIAVSQFTAADLRKELLVPPERITVIYEAAAPDFRPVEDKAVVAQVRQKYQLTSPYILFVGTIEPRKNLTTLLQAFTLVRREADVLLAMAGRKGWLYRPVFEAMRELGLEEHIRLLGPVENRELPPLYSGADVFVYPSLYEGFGLPPVEAMACGTPVVASDAASLPEVVGDAAVMVNPTDVEALARAILSVLGDHYLRDQLRARGLARAAEFSWDETARATLEVYHRVGGAR